MKFRTISFLVLFFFLFGCSAAQSNDVKEPKYSKINSFDECVEGGFPVFRSLPPKCATPDGRVFEKEMKKGEKLNPDNESTGAGCKDLCGDGRCQQIVCMAIGCPCSESPESCPEDCSSPFLR